MPGQRRLHSNRCSFRIPNFSYEDNVGILPQDRPESAREAQASAFIDLNLHNPRYAILDGIFDGDDVEPAPLNLRERSVERCRLTRSCGTCDEQKSLAGVEQVVKPCGIHLDRKSTRLNSSHVEISYAVFCLKKKTPERSSSPSPTPPRPLPREE